MKTLNLLGTLLFVLFSVQINAQDITINAKELPAPAQTFLKSYFSNATVLHAVKDVGNRKTDYEVRLSDGTEVEFTEKGEWKEVDGKRGVIPTGFIPKSILEYVKANYPNESITKIDKGHYDIDVDLTNGLELEFDLNGKFRRID